LASAIDLAANDPNKAGHLRDRHHCPLRPAIIERGLAYDLYDRYHNALNKREDSKEQAEELQRRGQARIDAGYTNSGTASYAAASSSYSHFIAKTDPITWSRNKETLTIVAQSFKGLADVQTRLAELTRNDELLTEAKSNAATAALLAPYQNTFKGSAVAAFAYASQNLGDPETAIMGYTTAAKLGYKRPWTLEHYDAAFQSKGSTMAVSQPPNYVPMGEYKTLPDGRLKNSMPDLKS
jgi:hypothetical protein